MLNDTENMLNQSLGFVETRSYIGAIEASDAMVKAADVRLVNFYKIGKAMVTVVVRGDLASCLAAVDAGKEAAMKVGELIASNVIARPFEDTDNLINFMISGSKKNKNAEQKTEPKDTTIPKTKKVKKKKDVEKEILTQLKKLNGAGLEQLSKISGIDKTDLRVILKKMIDQNQIEKAGIKYFIK